MSIKTMIASMVNDPESSRGRKFEFCAIAMILLFLAVFTFSSLPFCGSHSDEISCLSLNEKNGLQFIEAFLMIVFAVEYAVRVYGANQRKKYMLSGFGLVDGFAAGFSYWFIVLLAIELRDNEIIEAIHKAFEQARGGAFFRVIKVLFVFKLLKVLKPTLDVYLDAFRRARSDIVFFVLTAMILMYISAVLVWFFEKGAMGTNVHSILDALWWAVVTLSTVGYGDIILVTPAGKIIAFFIVMIGIIIVAVPAGLLASAFADAKKDKSGHRQAAEDSGKNKEGQKSGRMKDTDIAKQESNSG